MTPITHIGDHGVSRFPFVTKCRTKIEALLAARPASGAALVAHGIVLSEGLLVLPVSDVRVDGERLEGRGVTPTIEVPFHIRHANGRDPQLDRALEVAVKTLRQGTVTSRRRAAFTDL